MKIFPPVQFMPFADLSPGSLFLYPSFGKCVGLVASDDAGKKAVLLGPEYPEGWTKPFIAGTLQENAVSFMADLIVRLSPDPAFWSFGPPDEDIRCVAVSGNSILLRVDDVRNTKVYVDLMTGEVTQAKAPRAYCTCLAISFADEGGKETPFMSFTAGAAIAFDDS